MRLQNILPRDDYPYRVWCHVDLPEVNAAMQTACHCKSKETMLQIQNGQWEETPGEKAEGVAIHRILLDTDGQIVFELILLDEDNTFFCLESNSSFYKTTSDVPEIDDVAKKHGIIIEFDGSEKYQRFQEKLNKKLVSAQWKVF